MNIAVFVIFVIYSDLILAASTASVIGVLFLLQTNAPLPFCSPVEEHLGGWGWTGASVNTDEVIHNLDTDRNTQIKKEPPWRHPRPWDGILSSRLGTYPSEVPELWSF